MKLICRLLLLVLMVSCAPVLERGEWEEDTYNALRRAGITPYICSALLEWLVEALACDPENGLGVAPDEVFGVRFSDGVYFSQPVTIETE